MDKKWTGILSYAGGICWIAWLVAFLAGDKENAKFDLNQGLILSIAGVVCTIIPVIGWIVGIVVLVFSIMGIINATKNEEKALPVIGSWKILK